MPLHSVEGLSGTDKTVEVLVLTVFDNLAAPVMAMGGSVGSLNSV